MLKVFRDNLKNLAPVLWVVIAVFVLLMFAYPDGNPPASSSAAATVNGREISFADYQQAYRGLEDRFRGIYGDSYTPDLAKQIGLPMQALNSLVAQQILLSEADDIGLAATDEEVRETILEYPAFQDASGNFDNEAYQRVLKANRLTPEAFEASTREQLLLQKFNRVLADSVWISDAEAERSAREEVESAQIRFVKLTAADISEEQPIADEELAAYFEENQADYSLPEQRKLAYLTVNNNVVRASLEIPEDELKAYYDANPEEFTNEEQVRARHILLFVGDDRTAEQAQEQLEALKARVEAGEKFEDLAREFSEDEATKERGGNLGFFGRNRMTPQFEAAAFAGEVGSIVGPVENQLGPRTGYHLILIQNKREGGVQSFDEVKNRIRVRMVNDQARTRTEEYAKELAQQLEGKTFSTAEELEAIAEADELVGFQTTEMIDRDATIPGIGRNAAFSQAGFAVEPGTLSEPVRISAGWSLVTALEVEPPRIPELSEVEAQVRSAIQVEKKAAAAMARLAQVKESLGEDGTIDAIASELGKEATESGVIRARGSIAGIGNDTAFNKAVLELEEGDLAGPFETPEGPVVFEVSSRTKFDPETFKTEKAATLERLRNERVSYMVQSLIERRRGEIKLSVSPQLQETFEIPPVGTG